MAADKNLALKLAAEQTTSEQALEAEVGDFRIEVLGDKQGGTLNLIPTNGQALQITIEGGSLKLQYEGPRLQVSAPTATMEFAAQNIELLAEETVSVHGGREVDIHSGVDVEVRADHHVNLWGHDVLIGD
jgi:uncharacterized protein (DUF2345 family)